MWLIYFFLGLTGFAGGTAVSAGIFSLIVSLGIIPRMAAKTSVASRSMALENAVILGGICGTVTALTGSIPLHTGVWFLCLAGAGAGIFAGCLAVALAEVLNVFPVLFHRIQVKRGLSAMLTAFALGKALGACYYFLFLRG